MTQYSLLKRAEKLALLSKFVEGRLTDKVINDIRKSREPMYITMNLGEGDEPLCLDPDAPTYHIEVYSDNTTNCYYRYPDGRIEYRNA